MKLEAQASGYWSLNTDSTTVIAARIKLGSIVGGDIPLVLAWTAGSSRAAAGRCAGSAIRVSAPSLRMGRRWAVTSLFETSFEVRQRITGPWGVAAFVDAGSLSPSLVPNFQQVQAGAGVGLRYNLGFAPLRIDVATPITRAKGEAPVEFYISIGQAFWPNRPPRQPLRL